MRSLATRACFSRIVLLLLCTIPAAFVASIHAQVAGRNVNMVSGGTFPGGDPNLQKQNEPSVAMSTRNPCHLLAGANDYRAVNLQFPPGTADDKEVGDAWVGWYESTDCGSTWYSTLVPGYRQDSSPEGTASPVYGLSAGADPVVRSGAAGTFYYLFIAFNRGTNVGKLALARAIDHNDRDAFINPDKVLIDPDGKNNRRRALSPIGYAGTTEVARGSSGQFIDKPGMAVFPAAPGTFCTLDGETVPATNVYMAWTEFVGNSPENLRSKVYFARSADCGKTLAGPATKLSEGYPIGQGTSIAVNPNNPDDIYVVWRQIRNDRVKDALLFARSLDGGRSFSKAAFVPGFGEGQFAPFDQNTTSTARGSSTTTFRTVAYSSLAFADDDFLYMAVSQVPAPWNGGIGGAQARITMTRTNGGSWEAPVEVVTLDANGQQFMPALAYSAGRLQLVWYDVRFDEAKLNASALINEKEALGPAAPGAPAPPKIRRTIDLLGAQATIQTSNGTFAWPPEFQPYGVSQPDYNDFEGGARAQRGPRISQYLIGDPKPPSKQDQNVNSGPLQLQFNRGNLLLYGGGTIPFMGDYIDIGGIPWVLQGLRWVLNGKANLNNPALGTFQAAWTDNRDAGVGKATTTALPDGSSRLDYLQPLQLPAGSTLENAQCPVQNVDNTRTRDANVYTSRITQDFSLTVPVNSRQTNTPGVVRAFAVQLANNLPLGPGPDQTPASFRLTLTHNGSSFSRATFLGQPQSGGGCVLASAPVHQIDVDIYPRSSVTRTVYVTCGAAGSGSVVVTATRMLPGNPPTPGPAASVVINVDPAQPTAKGPDGQPLGPETRNPDAENPDAENPDAENPDAENPDAENPDAENPDAENPDAENPDAENPDAENPDAENPDAENPDAENPDAENANFQDVTTDITNTGNTTSGYQVVVNTADATAGYGFQLLANRVYSTPTSINCYLVKQNTNQQLFAIPLSGDDLTTGTFFDENSGDVRNATVLIRPGETVRVKLRIVWDADVITKPFCEPGKCHDKLEFRTRALAPNTGQTTPAEDSEGNVNSAFLSFVSQPTNSSTTSTIGGNEGPIRVRARDATGAVIPGLQITMELGDNPGETTLGGTLTQLTDEAGNAVFDNLTIDTAADGYSLVASANDAGSVESDPFDIDVSVGTVSDGTGDAVPGGGTLPAPDLVSATLTVNSGIVNISVRYAPGTFNATSTMVTLNLDIDENPATGSPGVDSDCENDSTSMGTDFLINTGGVLDGDNVFVLPHAGGCNSWGSSSNVGTRTVVTDGVDLVVPLSALGNDLGRLRFKVLTATSLPSVCPTCSTSVQDYMTDIGQAPGQVPTPIILFMR